MAINPRNELEVAKWHLDQAISALLQARQVQNLGKLGAARYEIVEALSQLNKEADINAPARFQVG